MLVTSDALEYVLFSIQHGGGRKCEVEECKKSARGEGLHCAEHAEKIALQNAHAAAAVSNGKVRLNPDGGCLLVVAPLVSSALFGET